MLKKFSLASIAAILVLSFALAGCGQQKNQAASPAPSATKSVGDEVNHQIIGIDPGAGEMGLTKKAMQAYGLSDWKLVEGSGAAMTLALKKAYEQKKPIIVLGWTPHWMFSKFKLKYLKDPKGIYGKSEYIDTVVHKGFKAKDPGAYQILSQFKWTAADMEKVMLTTQNGTDAKQAAKDWIKNNADKVAKWTAGAPKGKGQKVTIAYVAWASAIASTDVISQVLRDQGYNVTETQVDAAPMWAGVAGGSADAMVAAWLPTTHAQYYAKYKDQVVDVGHNLVGTKEGMVVPQYMTNVNSIADLKDK